MKKLLALLLLASSFAFGGSVTGQITTATSGPIVNGTLTFTLTQAAVQVGSSTVVTSPVNCYTDRGGNIVSQPDPLVAPTVTTNTGSGTLAAGTYFTEFTYYDASGTSFGSFETTTLLSSTGTLIVTPPVLQPATATGWKIFISTTSGAETLQSTQVGFSSTYQQSSALVVGSALPSSNTSVCKLLFNDQLIPSGTGYRVGFVNSSGSNVSGFPQKWYLSGGAAGTINVSSGTPSYNSVVVYPQAIVATPAANAPQSISGPLSLGGFNLTAGSGLFSGNVTVGGTFSATTFNATTYQVGGVAQSGTGPLLAQNSPTIGSSGATFSGSTSGSTIVKASATASGTLTLPAATGTLALGIPAFQKFVANGTFTIPPGVTGVRVTLFGGGAGGGGATATNVGAGGGSGGYAIKYLSGLTPGNTIAVTVGTGGTGVSGAAGNSGAASTIASGTQTITTVTANGGIGGGSQSAVPIGGGGAAAISTNGDINGAGVPGDTGFSTAAGVKGGSTMLGGAGNVVGGSTAGTSAVANTGSGGGGAGAGATNAGGNGAAGMVLFEWVQ